MAKIKITPANLIPATESLFSITSEGYDSGLRNLRAEQVQNLIEESMLAPKAPQFRQSLKADEADPKLKALVKAEKEFKKAFKAWASSKDNCLLWWPTVQDQWLTDLEKSISRTWIASYCKLANKES